MKTITHTLLSAISPVICVVASLAILRASHLPFPADLAWHALPQWIVMASLVYTSSVLFRFVLDQIFHAPAQALQPNRDS